MDIKTVTHEQMDALKALSDTNMKVSEAKNVLTSLQEMETEYLVQRENKAVEVINRVLEESNELIKQTKSNYQEVKDFLNTTSSFATSLTEIYQEVAKVVDAVDERSKEWELSVKAKEAEVGDIKQRLEVDRVIIENEKKNIKSMQAQLNQEKRKLADERGTLERAFTRLKEGRI